MTRDEYCEIVAGIAQEYRVGGAAERYLRELPPMVQEVREIDPVLAGHVDTIVEHLRAIGEHTAKRKAELDLEEQANDDGPRVPGEERGQ